MYLWSGVCSGLLPSFWKSGSFSYCWVLRVLCVLGWQFFIGKDESVSCLPILSTVSGIGQAFLAFINSSLSTVSFMGYNFSFVSKKSSPYSRVTYFPLCYLLGVLLLGVLHLSLWTILSSFLWGIGLVSRFIFWHVYVPTSRGSSVTDCTTKDDGEGAWANATVGINSMHANAGLRWRTKATKASEEAVKLESSLGRSSLQLLGWKGRTMSRWHWFRRWRTWSVCVCVPVLWLVIDTLGKVKNKSQLYHLFISCMIQVWGMFMFSFRISC